MTDDQPELEGRAALHVLLVEGDEMTREFLRGILEQDGVAVDAVATAAEALEALQAQAIDLVLASYPGGDGVDLTRLVRDQAGGALPIVYLAAALSAEQRYRVIAAGADDFLAKPVDPNVLL